MKISIVVLSKDEPRVADTLGAAFGAIASASQVAAQVLVVDASEGRLDDVRIAYPEVDWINFRRPRGVAVSIPHQRNVGVQAAAGEVIIFIDSGCTPRDGWLERLLEPIASGEELIAAGSAGAEGNVYLTPPGKEAPRYLQEAATLNLAVHRRVFERIGGFDQRFAYGSDIDFTWRAVDAGFRIRHVPEAVVDHDWGNLRRRLRRARQYGAARIRLYAKHTGRVPRALVEDPVPLVYPLWLLGLPIAARRPLYLLLLAVPLWRARRHPYPYEVVATHVVEGFGALEELVRVVRGRWP